jgi:maltodextrin utilization protein YvdJ
MQKQIFIFSHCYTIHLVWFTQYQMVIPMTEGIQITELQTVYEEQYLFACFCGLYGRLTRAKCDEVTPDVSVPHHQQQKHNPHLQGCMTTPEQFHMQFYFNTKKWFLVHQTSEHHRVKVYSINTRGFNNRNSFTCETSISMCWWMKNGWHLKITRNTNASPIPLLILLLLIPYIIW